MPYRKLPKFSFWSGCRTSPNFAIDNLYAPKFPITSDDKIATIGSCFAQHIGRRLKSVGAQFLDMEAPPRGLSAAQAAQFGFGLFSARYGNVYSPKQLHQLAHDSRWRRVDWDAIWLRDGRFFDALRPSVEPDGLATAKAVALQRCDHLHRVARLFRQCDVLIITLGLTEYWANKRTGRAYATCPGVIAGEFYEARHTLRNATYNEARKDLVKTLKILRRNNRSMRVVLTVSPVPMTATATGGHVLAANAYSKATLRAVAGDMAARDPLVDYFPAYEMVALQLSSRELFAPNLRQVSAEGVDLVMSHFFAAHPEIAGGADSMTDALKGRPDAQSQGVIQEGNDEICEDLLLEAMRTQ